MASESQLGGWVVWWCGSLVGVFLVPVCVCLLFGGGFRGFVDLGMRT